MKIHYYFGECFTYEVNDEFVKQHFGEKPDDETADDWMNEVCEYFEDEALEEYERICKENESALEDLKDSYMRSV